MFLVLLNIKTSVHEPVYNFLFGRYLIPADWRRFVDGWQPDGQQQISAFYLPSEVLGWTVCSIRSVEATCTNTAHSKRARQENCVKVADASSILMSLQVIA